MPLKDKEIIKSGKHKYGNTFDVILNSDYSINWSRVFKVNDVSGRKHEFRQLVIPVGNTELISPVTEIYSFDDFLIITSEPTNTQFYRGQGDFAYLPLPGVLRSNKKDYEYKTFTEVISKNPQEYYNIKNLEKLTKIQHKDLPTRLLDISSSPLVSLFFALSSFQDTSIEKLKGDERIEKLKKDVKNLKKKVNPSDLEIELSNINQTNDSWFFAFNPDENLVRTFDSDRCYLLSAIPYLTDDEQQELRYDLVMDYLIQNYARFLDNKNIRNVLMNLVDKVKKAPDYFLDYGNNSRKKLDENSNIEFNKDSFIIENIIFKYDFVSGFFIFWPDGYKDVDKLSDDEALFLDKDNHYLSYQMERLHAKVSHELPSFRRCAYATDLLNGVFVRPIFNSDRMIAQQGAFMMFGLSSFWDIKKLIIYLYKKNYKFSEIISFLILNDDKFLCYNAPTKIKRQDLRKIKECMSNVMDARLYRIAPESKPILLERLYALGITKETLGRSDLTTVYHLNDILPKKE